MGLIRNEACPTCSKTGHGKSLAVYDDGVYCHECGYTEKEEGMTEVIERPKKELKPLIPIGQYRELKARHISKEVATKYKTTITEYNGEPAICFSYYEKGAIVAQKLKLKKVDGKSRYVWLGDKSKVPPLWGMNLFEPNPKLSVTICEGELDMMCLATMDGGKWPVLSLVDGAGPQALKSLAKAKDYLNGFNKIILMFDGDSAGRECAQSAAEILGRKVKIAQTPDKEDVCSLARQGLQSEISRLQLTAVGYRPKDIVTVSDYTDEELYTEEAKGLELPFPKLNSLLRGIKPASLYMICSGSGLGKSTIVKEIAYDLMFNQGKNVGCIFLEQGDKEAMKDYIAMDNNIESESFNMNPDLIPEEDRNKSRDVLSQRGFFYKHFGSLDSDTLVAKIEYMMEGCECDYVILDHISMAVSGNLSPQGERKDIDILMTKLRSAIQKTGKTVIAVSHLRRPPPDKKDFNNGGEINLSHLRGSASIEQISDYVIGLERDQFSELEEDRDTIKLKVLKCRRGGKIGYADTLTYSHETGRLNVIDKGETQ